MAAKKKSERVSSSAKPAGRSTVEPQATAGQEAPRRQQFFVVGIGASAGGLDAFKKFFDSMPADSGIAFVLIPHLDPTHESLMAELLSRHTAMPVVEATDQLRIEANRLYVIPPNNYMTMSDGVLKLTGPIQRSGSATSIDLFLRSLADDQQDRAICVILSGTGSSGTLGLKAVKAHGGMAMVQDPKTAAFDRMPLSAVATGLPDFVLPPEQMPAALIQFVRHFSTVDGDTRMASKNAVDSISQILALLRSRTKYDFNCYRKKMLVRRIERRMSLSQIAELPAYLKFLRENPAEIELLARDLFISVTSFFRDADAFRALETEAIRAIIESKESDRPIRIWVPGCATGEEPYSIAMLVVEQLAVAQRHCPVQIFATDVDGAALEIARSGMYPDSIAHDVSSERLARFFTRTDDHTLQVVKSLRESVVFAVQNVIADPPFSKMDLISCRNLLIYLEPEVQKKVIALFHFALNAGGYLFLGPSETIGRQTDVFEPVSKKWRMYHRIGPVRLDRVDFPFASHVEKIAQSRRTPEAIGKERPINFAEVAHASLLEAYAPAAVLINRRNEILYYFGPTMRFLDQPTGEPTQDLMLLAREGLRTKLRMAIQKVLGEGQRVTERGLRYRRDSGYKSATISVHRVQTPKVAEGMLLVTFEDENEGEPVPPASSDRADESLVQQLEFELKGTREDLQSTVEEMERSNEELKATHEEVMSMNEELQSANEELETSKEELQSLNEELNTVNSQLQDKLSELETVYNDLGNLLTSTDIATLFLDPAFRIKRFTPAATKLFNLIATDEGRPLADIAPKFLDGDLLRDAELVLRDLTPIAEEVPTPTGSWYLRRILPYRTKNNRIEGVVVTFADVTPLKQASERLRRLATVLTDSNDGVTVHSFNGQITAWNRGAQRMYGYTEAEALQMNIETIVPPELHAENKARNERFRAGHDDHSWETQRVQKDGRILDVWITATILKDDAGNPTAVATTERDITDRKAAERVLRKSEHTMRQKLAEIQAIYAAAPVGLASLDADLRFASMNEHFAQMIGLPVESQIGRTPKEILPEMGDAFAEISHRIMESGQPELDVELLFPSKTNDGGESVWMWRCYPLFDPNGQPRGVSAAIVDVTARKQMEKEILALNDRLEERVAQRTAELNSANGALQEEITNRKRAQEAVRRLAAIVESSDDAIVGKTLDGTITSWNSGAERIYGYTAQEMIGRSVFQLNAPNTHEELKAIHERVRHGEYVEHHEVRHLRKDQQEIVVSLTNSPIRNEGGEVVGISAIGRDITRQQRMEMALRESRSRLAAIVDTAGDGLITIDEEGNIDTFNRSAEKLFGYTADEVIGRNLNMLMPSPYREAHDGYLENYRNTGARKIIGIGREVIARRKDGSTFPIDLAVSEFHDGTRRLFTGLIRDISKRKILEKEVLEIAAQEQRRIGQDLHDSVGQELTGLGLVAETLADTLTRQDHADAALAGKIVSGAKRILAEIRGMSRGLLPVEVDAAGLVTALTDLAARVREQSKVECTFMCEESFRWDDNIAATHYYRIAQEAIANALKHGRAKRIEILLQRSDQQVTLRIWNDGIPIRSPDPANEGMGLKIMHYRAGLINAVLNLEPAERGGTILSCTSIEDRNHERG